MKQPDEVLAVRVPPALKRELKKLAGQDNRTLSNLVEVLLSKALQDGSNGSKARNGEKP